ncbi:phage protein [Escherichia coli]|nr:phage protein [Escherichia coli]
MKHPHDNIRVGAITFVYSVTKRGWVFPTFLLSKIH